MPPIVAVFHQMMRGIPRTDGSIAIGQPVSLLATRNGKDYNTQSIHT